MRQLKTKVKLAFCIAVLYLNHIPRFGRLYYLDKYDNKKREWRFMRNGFWGINILDRMGLFWWYTDQIMSDDWEVIDQPIEGEIRFTQGWDRNL